MFKHFLAYISSFFIVVSIAWCYQKDHTYYLVTEDNQVFFIKDEFVFKKLQHLDGCNVVVIGDCIVDVE